MGLFNDADEAKRRANLKAMEDRRLRFAERMQAEGFAPQKMVLSIPFIVNKNCALLCEGGKNPLLRARRRRGDANVVWEFPPVEKKMLAKFRAALREILEEAPQG